MGRLIFLLAIALATAWLLFCVAFGLAPERSDGLIYWPRFWQNTLAGSVPLLFVIGIGCALRHISGDKQ
jgi:hypothetical protein